MGHPVPADQHIRLSRSPRIRRSHLKPRRGQSRNRNLHPNNLSALSRPQRSTERNPNKLPLFLSPLLLCDSAPWRAHCFYRSRRYGRRRNRSRKSPRRNSRSTPWNSPKTQSTQTSGQRKNPPNTLSLPNRKLPQQSRLNRIRNPHRSHFRRQLPLQLIQSVHTEHPSRANNFRASNPRARCSRDRTVPKAHSSNAAASS